MRKSYKFEQQKIKRFSHAGGRISVSLLKRIKINKKTVQTKGENLNHNHHGKYKKNHL